jgi:hypothetical protein
MTEQNWRPLTDSELAVIQRLLVAEFEGVQELRQQLDGIMARIIDEDGSIKFLVTNKIRAQARTRVPVEGNTSITEGEPYQVFAPHVNVLLHVVEGLLDELEIYCDDGSEGRLPQASELHIFTPYHWEND